VQIQSSDEQVTSIKISMGGWCDSSDGQVTEKEISFPCAFELAGRRISFSFTLDRLSGAFEQRFFVGGKLQQVHYGSCTWKTGATLSYAAQKLRPQPNLNLGPTYLAIELGRNYPWTLRRSKDPRVLVHRDVK
jgi:hypothetical protein